ncbi:unnamed protein product [Sphagnum compactum]
MAVKEVDVQEVRKTSLRASEASSDGVLEAAIDGEEGEDEEEEEEREDFLEVGSVSNPNPVDDDELEVGKGDHRDNGIGDGVVEELLDGRCVKEEGAEEEDEIVDVSPSGLSLESLAYTKRDVAARFKKMYVYDNSFPVLPASIGEFKHLRKLKFFSNEVKILPDGVGELQELEHLYLKMSPSRLGSLPPLGKLSGLRALELHQAPTPPSAATLSRDIAQLHSLTRLSICHFSLSWIPPEIGSLGNLEELDLSFNKLKALPQEFARLKALKSLRVASNKLVELPSQLAALVNLINIDVAHNRLTSLQSLGLLSMTSLRSLNAQFNRLQSTGQIPEWLCCQLEGNEWLKVSNDVADSKNATSNEKYLLDWELPCAAKGSSPILKGSTQWKRRGWRKQDNQQQRARQDRLNSSRKHRPDEQGADVHEVKSVVTNLTSSSTENALSVMGLGSELQPKRILSTLEQALPDNLRSSDNENIMDLQQQCGLYDCTVEEERPVADAGGSIKHNNVKSSLTFLEENSKPNVESEDDGGSGELTDASLGLRRHGSDTDRNPKPSKRRRSAQDFSKLSYKYCSESFCGFNDRLPDGFYDAGRDRQFCSLDVLEKEQPSFDSREVILVDREQDEELDAITLSAQQLLGRLGSLGSTTETCRGVADNYQRAAVLALFVSDCFGGSDKTQNITNMRRAALGVTAGEPFVCSCSASASSQSTNRFGDGHTVKSVPEAIPSVHLLCEGAVRFLKAQRGSNVLPIGSLQYGVCRHRAILLKYLCDRADPIIPCELVRGYLDYMPHAWNIILVQNGSASVRMLVDGCRPFDIRQEIDPEYFCRYIPLKRFHMPMVMNGGQMTLDSEIASPVLHEEIGHGASGAIVHRCTFATFTAAAKVRELEGGDKSSIERCPESSCLSELRILCSLGTHPCIVTFYGHQFMNMQDRSLQLLIFMEHIQGGSLEDLLQDMAIKGQTSMPMKLACQVARNLACALAWLHSKGILHRDVKSSNVLIDIDAKQSPDGGPIVKLCDFDRAVPLSSSAVHTCYLAHRGVPAADVCVGTPRWIAPEVLRAMYGRHPYGFEADMWSFGCLLSELLTLHVPYAGLSESEVHSRIQIGQRPQLPPDLDRLVSKTYHKSKATQDSIDDSEMLRVLVRLFYSCTEACPSQRPSAKEVFTLLSSILGSTPAAVDPALLEMPTNDSMSCQVARSNVLQPLAGDIVEPPSELSEVTHICSCAGKKCTSCDESSIDLYSSKGDSNHPVNTKQT